MKNEKKYSPVGGQAVIEGVMMRGTKAVSIAVRKPNGEIEMKTEPLKKSALSWIGKIPLLRGAFALVSSMIIGVRALTYSAEFFMDDEEMADSKFDLWLKDKFGEKAENLTVFFSIVFAAMMSILMFAVAPTFLTSLFKSVVDNPLALSVFEGLLKIFIFLAYIFLISRLNDVKRVFQYHGAEHKCIHCLESGQELTVENAQKFGTLHPRCGTSFLLIVMTISIAIFTFVGWGSPVLRVLLKILLFPFVAGVSFEIIRWAGKSNSIIVRAISYPGMMLQKMTTNAPDDEQVEVALAALKAVLDYEKGGKYAEVVVEGTHAGESS